MVTGGDCPEGRGVQIPVPYTGWTLFHMFVLTDKNYRNREVVVAQLVERSLSIPEVCGLTPVIGKIY